MGLTHICLIMTKTQTQKGITQMFEGMEKIAMNGGYKEREELLNALYELSWFDNFGYEYYQHRLTIAQMAIDEGMKYEDIPQLLREELGIEE
jgi:hypothetical protein